VAPDLTLGDIVHDNALRFGDLPAYRAEENVITHGELRSRATALASALAADGMRRQDRIAVLGRNSVEFGEVLAAGQVSGLIVATVNFRLAAPEMLRILTEARPRVLFCDAEYVPVVQALRPELHGLQQVICFGPADAPGVTAYADLLASGDPDELPFAARPDDVACLIFTSGTTGRAKGCILGQREMRRLAQVMNVEMRTGCADRVLLTMPIFHIGAMAIGLGVHARGGTAVLHRQFDPVAFVDAVRDQRITVLHLAPTMLQAVLDSEPDVAALAGVRTVVYSAAPITGRTLQAAMAAMPHASFHNLYGQTEVITSGLPPELHRTDDTERDRRRLASVGHPFADTEVRIVAPDGEDCAPGRPGEIAVRSAAMFRGYWNDHVETAATIRDGWCHTGDIGVFDEEGLLHLVDRKKDVIISGGENVYSPEVEEAVLTHEGVAACAVIGVPDRRWGETVCAVVVAAPGAKVSPEGLREHVRARLARYKAPRRVVMVDELPLLPTGKVDKKGLRETFGGETPPGPDQPT
jgi:acyl-CoA synthetase (AMP-forming)/AMP-acid ligase II